MSDNTRQGLIEALDHYMRQDETAGDIDNGVYRRGKAAMAAALSEDFAPAQAGQAAPAAEALTQLHDLLYAAQVCTDERRDKAIADARILAHKLRNP